MGESPHTPLYNGGCRVKTPNGGCRGETPILCLGVLGEFNNEGVISIVGSVIIGVVGVEPLVEQSLQQHSVLHFLIWASFRKFAITLPMLMTIADIAIGSLILSVVIICNKIIYAENVTKGCKHACIAIACTHILYFSNTFVIPKHCFIHMINYIITFISPFF